MPERFAKTPLLVFWETTRACLLACRHCRAEAQPDPSPDELTTDEGYALIDQIGAMGSPHPVLVLTGGDCLRRSDLEGLVSYARQRGVHTAISPSVTPDLTEERLRRLRQLGASAASISLDGASAAVHDRLRGIPGHFAQTVDALGVVREVGLKTQVNTTVMADTVDDLAEVLWVLVEQRVAIWEVFFLVQTGRGSALGDVTPSEAEAVCHFLVDAACYGLVVRTVEAPWFRRVVRQRAAGVPPRLDAPAQALYERLRSSMQERLGPPRRRSMTPTVQTRDGAGVIFVGHRGDVMPSGFLPLSLGNVRTSELGAIYSGSAVLRAIRASDYAGRCGVCDFRQLCGGSRARAFAATGNPLGEDPMCAYLPVAS